MESSIRGSRPRTQKKSVAKDSPSEDRPFRGQGHEGSKKNDNNNKVFNFFFRRFEEKRFSKSFSVISKKQRLQKIFSGNLQSFNDLKNSAVFEPRILHFYIKMDYYMFHIYSMSKKCANPEMEDAPCMHLRCFVKTGRS